MRAVYAKILMCVVLLLALSGISGDAMAFNAIETYQNQIQGRLKKGDTLVLKDEKFQNSAFDWSTIHNKTVSNMITFGLYRDSGAVFPKAFKCEIDLKVEYWTQADLPDPIVEDHIKLQVTYDPGAGVAYKDADLYRFLNGHKVRVTINDITSAELGSDFPPIFRLASQVIVERWYDIDNSKHLAPQYFIIPSANDTTSRGVSLAWETITGAEEYDLEWTFIDEDSDNGALLAAQPGSVSADVLKKMFRNNATRVTVQQEYYDISLVHHSKYLLIRIRPVQYRDNGFRQEFAWEYQIKDGATTKSSVIVLGDNPWHESGKNWQYNAVYAEDGKKKEVVSYYDGSLRSRQTVTVNNSDKNAVVQEAIYDEFGRPLATIMPVPLKSSVFKYYPGLHIGQGDSTYNFKHVYGNATACVATPLPLKDSGAARYYSANNEFLGDSLRPENAYIPDAEGYPLAVMRYTNDNTNRVSVQGSVGPRFQPGATGAVQYFYGVPTQWELDRLFGNDVGYYSHYLKNVVIDGNGQASIAYLDASGRTIATALAGKSPGNLDSLPSSAAPVEHTDIILDRQFTFDPTRMKISATATHISTVAGPVKLRFDVSRLVKMYADKGVDICSNCYYEGSIYITDNCGNEIYKTVTPWKIGDMLDSCLTADGVVTRQVDTIFGKGEYYIKLEIGIPENAINFYTAAFIKRNKNLRTEWSFVKDALLEKDLFSCFNDCATCKESLGELSTFRSRITERLIADKVDVTTNTAAINAWIDSTYASLYSQCAVLRANCNTSPCAELEKQLKEDVSPGGQYALFTAEGGVLEADINVLSRYWRQAFKPLPKDSADYIQQQFELEDGRISSPHDSAFTVQLLVKYWNSEWASRFVQYHPEYCALRFCQDNATSLSWDNRLRDVATTVADIPVASGGAIYSKSSVNWLIDKDPFFTARPDYKELFKNDLANYSRNVAGITTAGASVKHLSGFVDYMLYCADYTGSTNANNIPDKNANNWNNCQPVSTCIIPDREWDLYKTKYLELKEQYYNRLRDSSIYCGARCTIGSSNRVAYTVDGCPATGDFIIESGSEACAADKQSVRISYLGSRLNKTVAVTIYYPAEYKALVDTTPVTLSPGNERVNLCISNKVLLSTLRVSGVSCGTGSGGNDFCATHTKNHFEFVFNSGSGRAYFQYINGALPAGVKPVLDVVFGDENGNEVCSYTFRRWDANGLSERALCDFIGTPTILQKTLYCDNVPVDPNPVVCNPAYQSKTSRINNISYSTPEITTDTTELKNMAAAGIQAMIDRNCESQADNWIGLLGACEKMDTTKRTTLRNKLIEICKMGGDVNHPNGASTLPAGKTTAEGYTSFKDAILGVLGITGKPGMLCNPYLLDVPYPYEVKAQIAEQTLTSTNPDVCQRLSELTAAYTAANTTDSFHIYLKKTYGAAMNITAAELALLQTGCSNCRYLLKQPVKLPVFMDRGAKGCITAAEYTQAMAALTAFAGDSLIADHSNYERIVTNYLNGRFGFSLSYSVYEAYRDTVAKNPSLTMLLCNSPVYVSVTPDQYECLMQVIDDAVVSGRDRYRTYIEEVKRLFRKDYVAICGANKPVVSLTSLQQTYHYTLYYYDQAGNLIRTVPPEGVHPLNDSLAKYVDGARGVRDTACNGKYQPDNKTKDAVLQTLTQAFDRTTNEAMEMWVYNAGNSESQVLSTTGGKKYLFNVCISGGYLNFDVYTATLSGADADVVLSAHTTVSLMGVGPLTNWTHIVIQGAGFNANNMAIYVNGKRCPSVTQVPTGACGWSLEGNSAGVIFPENLSLLRHLRLYNHLLPDDVIAANAGVSCLSPSDVYNPAGTDSLTLWALFNGATGGSSSEQRYVPVYPAHTLATSYAYQSLNGIQVQRTPDAGVSHFWYDMLGRNVVSQNAEQANPIGQGLGGRQSYTRFDAQGRVIEVGEKLNAERSADSVAFVTADVLHGLYETAGQQVVRTYYDNTTDYVNMDAGVAAAQQNLRKRVAASTYTENDGDPQQVTYYSYDQLGNVKTLWQQIQGLGVKKVDYQYDLASGKVNKVGYQTGGKDKFFYGYEYDAENRLTKAFTGINAVSSDGWHIENAHTDARYRYFLHGPLARTELGHEHLVQGMDYAYTLQGWLKGVNGQYLQADKEMGFDGVKGRLHGDVARDAYAYTLDYFKDDYKPIGVGNAMTTLSWTAGQQSETGRDLFNGNISRSTLAIKRINDDKSSGYTYRYDQLNRLKAMRQHALVSGATSWSAASAGTAYKEDVTYDANGNILSYLRNGSSTRGDNMDQLSYVYAKDASGNLLHNKLLQVKDAVDNPAYTEDLKNQNVNNYLYDNIGNLIADKQGAIDSVVWNVYGKIARIRKSDGSVLQYGYDPTGNRVYKLFIKNGVVNRTWYVRDAQGNTLAVYGNKDGDANVYWEEQHLYGSSRLGVWNPDVNVTTDTSVNRWLRLGLKQYELTNHLGNVLATISDKPVDSVIGGVRQYFVPELLSAQDYYPFGMLQPDRKWSLGEYRYGFNGKENDNEVKGEGNSVDFGARIYDPRVGRWLSVDNVFKPNLSSYQYSRDNPVNWIDPDGADEIHFVSRRKAYVDGSGVRYGPSTTSIQVVKKDGPDRFFHRQVTDVVNLIYPKPSSWYQTNVGAPSEIFDHTETSPNKEFYPRGDGPNGQGGIFNSSGITTRPDWFGLVNVGEDDFTSLARLASPELVNYLESKDAKKYGALRVHKAGLTLSRMAQNTASIMLIVAYPSAPAKQGHRLNIWGEGEAAGFIDVATNDFFAQGRALTTTFANGSAAKIVINNSPVRAAELAEIQRLSSPGTIFSYSAPADGGFFTPIGEFMKDKGVLISDQSVGTGELIQRTVQYKMK